MKIDASDPKGFILEGSLPTKWLTLVGSSYSGVMALTLPSTQRLEITQLSFP